MKQIKMKLVSSQLQTIERIEQVDKFGDLQVHSEKVFEKLWEDENDEIWTSYISSGRNSVDAFFLE